MREDNINDSMYPLSFVLKYVGEKRDELASLETSTLQNMFELNDTGTEILDFLQKSKEPNGSLSAENVNKLFQSISGCLKKVNIISSDLTQKSMVFEDMNNILRQTESITSALIMRDTLTLAYNRYFYFANAEKLYTTAEEYNGLSMAFIDVDHFRDFNSSHGHDFGDRVLKHFANIVEEVIGLYSNTYFIRVGGDEFVILNSGNLNYSEFNMILSTISTKVAKTPVKYENTLSKITISIGAANSKCSKTSSLSELYKLADENLYKAKDTGRNRIVS
ncbi:MAG: GGDEF domain-containing protein [Butyrivibrio sp.]|nr:GGDEF domain-containing protein [Butyrivibrio sp.]